MTSRSRHRVRSVLAVAVIAVSGAGCSTEPGSGTQPASEGVDEVPESIVDGWVASNPTAAWFVNLIQTADGSLSGTTNLAQISSDGLEVDRLDGPIVGSVDGDDVVLSAFGQTWSGSFTNGTLRISFPSQTTGELADAVLARGEAADYNAAVRALNVTVEGNLVAAREADAEAAAAREQAAASAAVEEERAAADLAAATAAAETGRLLGVVESDTDDLLSQMVELDPITRMQESLAAMGPYIDELDSVDCMDAEFAAGDLAYAADTVLYDAGSTDYDADTILWHVDLLEQSVVQLRGAADSSQARVEQVLASADIALDDALAMVDQWQQESSSIQAQVAAETQGAFSRAVSRCDIFTTWEPQFVE